MELLWLNKGADPKLARSPDPALSTSFAAAASFQALM